jgi:hypothetical protein
MTDIDILMYAICWSVLYLKVKITTSLYKFQNMSCG